MLNALFGFSVFGCLQPVSVFYKMWAKCNFIFKNCTNGPSGTLNCWGNSPVRALSGITGWRGKAKLYVWGGVYHWKSMKVQGTESWTALYFVVQGHCVSPEVFYLWTSHIMFPHWKWRAWNWWALEPFPLRASVRTEPGCFLVDLTCGVFFVCLFWLLLLFLETFKN